MKKSKKLLTLSLVFTAPLLALSSFAIKDAIVEAQAEETSVGGSIITNDVSNFIESTNATVDGNSFKATSASFDWQTKKINGNSTVDFLSEQTLELNAFGDWKWEYLTFSTTQEKGIDAANGMVNASNSVSLVWGWVNGFSIIEKDATGNVIFNGKLGLEAGENIIVAENFPNDSEILRQFQFYCFDKPFRIITSMNETNSGVVFNFRLITKSPWGHDIDTTFSYESVNQDLKGEKHVTYGRTGSGTIDETHNIVMTMGIVDKSNYSASDTNWLSKDNAIFTGNTMKATSPSFNWQTTQVGGNSKVDFTSTQSLALSAMADWKWEYLTFSKTNEVGINAGNGMVNASNSVSLVWGWTNGFSIIEKDADGNVVYNGRLGLTAGDNIIVPDNFINDENIMNQFHYYCYDKAFRIVTQMNETASGVEFTFHLITKSPWGHDIDATFTYVSTSQDLKGGKFVTYGRTGSGTIDETHNIELLMKIDNVEAIDTPVVPTDTLECELSTGSSLQEVETTSGFAHTYQSEITLTEGNEFNVNLKINDVVTSFGFDNVNSFVDSSNNENKFSGAFYSQGSDGKIKIDVNGKYKVTVNVNEANEAIIDLEVLSYNLIDTANKYHASADNWATLYNASITDGQMAQTGAPSLTISNQFGGNATVKYVLDYTTLDANWGGVALIIKGNASDLANVTWSFVGDKATPSGGSGSFVALCISHAGYQLLVCDEGNLNVLGSDQTFLIPGVDGFSFWHVGDQKTEIVMTTTDVDDGVKLNISYFASGHSQNTGGTYTTELLLPYKSLWGAQVASMVYVTGERTPNNTNNNVKLYVSDSESTYTNDLYHASVFKDKLAEINYETITDSNYSTILSKFESLKAVYATLTDEQKALISSEETAKFAKIESDLAAAVADKYECKFEDGTTIDEVDTENGYLHSYEKTLSMQEGNEFNIDLFINDVKSSYGFDKVTIVSDASTNEVKYQGDFVIAGNDGKIKVLVPGTYKVLVNVTEEKDVEISVLVMSYDLIDTANKYHSSQDNWATLYNATIADSTMSQTGAPSLSITNSFGGNATIKYVLDYTNLDSPWAATALLLKGQASDLAKATFTFDASNNTVKVNSNEGSFIALCITHGCYQLVVVENGNVNIFKTDLDQFIPGFDGHNFWYIGQQKTEVVIDVKDVADGVTLKIYCKASGHAGNKEGTFASDTLLLPYKSLWGEQSAGMVYVTGHNAPNGSNNQVSLFVADSESTYTKDLYHANMFHDALAAINYETINDENYARIVNMFNQAKIIFESLTDVQKELVLDEDKARLTQIESDINNVDALVLAKLALERLEGLDTSFNRANYAEKAEMIKDALDKYELLTDEEKATCDASKLNELKEALELYENILSYADPVCEMINKIVLPIENYGVQSRIINQAKAAYDKLYPEEQAEVYNYEDLLAAIEALQQYDVEHAIDGYNFTSSLDNFMELNGYGDCSIVDGKLVVNSSEKDLSIYPTIAVENGKEITWVINSNLEKCSWGNFYFIIKSDSLQRHHSNGKWLEEGNYTVLLIGGDGFKIVECKDGVIPMTSDANGNPIANFTTILDNPSDEEGSQLDVHHIYKNYTTLKLTTIDLYENDVYVGYKLTITLTGGVSGKTFTREYISTNASSKDADYFGLELFVSNPINNGTGGFEVKGIYVEDVDNYDGAQVKEDIENRKLALACDNLLSAVIVDVNKENLSEAKAAYEAAKEAYDSLTAAQKALLTQNVDVLEQARVAIKDVEDSINNERPSEEPSEEPSEQPSEQPSTQPSEEPSTQPSDDNDDKPSKKGCKGTTTGGIASLITLIGALFIKKRRK
ncbi:MAG: tetratricopeptide repeat protein [Erysipelotrichaceae bacterium]|nr:tetratricopeptide repeat protein [Erysipelotrichaceae bacterium]